MRWFLGVTIFIYLISPCCSHTHGVDDHMGWHDKGRCFNISDELIREAYLKIRQISEIRNEHSYRLSFNVGLVLGNIRERYRRMLETYREYRDKYTGRSTFFPPTFREKFASIYYVQAMELVHALEVDIDKLVHVLESIDNEDLNPDPRYDFSTRRPLALRASDIKEIARMAEEQEMKSRNREKHLFKKLGLPGNRRTPRKRFQHQWPVERNWELGAYGDMGVYSK